MAGARPSRPLRCDSTRNMKPAANLQSARPPLVGRVTPCAPRLQPAEPGFSQMQPAKPVVPLTYPQVRPSEPSFSRPPSSRHGWSHLIQLKAQILPPFTLTMLPGAWRPVRPSRRAFLGLSPTRQRPGVRQPSGAVVRATSPCKAISCRSRMSPALAHPPQSTINNLQSTIPSGNGL